MEYKVLLIKYAEIGTKGNNRHMFENALRDQIKLRLSRLGQYAVIREQGRILIECEDGYDYDETIEALSKIFGIWGISPAVVVESTKWEDIVKSVFEYINECFEEKNFTFKVYAKRADKKYPMTSPDICREMGAAILNEYPELKVDVHNPDVMITIEVRHRTYVYSKSIKGPGGMPSGTSGRATLLLSGGIDSPVAGYMAAKRGVKIDAVYFHAPPYTSERAKQKVVDLAGKMSEYTGAIKLHVVNFTNIQMYIYDKCPHEQLTIIMRRYMMKISEIIARKNKSMALITGESLGQVASQTMESLYCTNDAAGMPVFRPVIGFDKQEIIHISEKIGTYEISIEPFEDCCTIFVAKHPVTHPSLELIKESEEKLTENIDSLIKEALESVEIIMVE